MTETTSNTQKLESQEPEEVKVSSSFNSVPPEILEKHSTEFSPVDRRSSGNTGLFNDHDAIFSTVVPRTTHWSVAWADLMMTMFILFLSMFVYQAAHQDFLVSDEHGIIGGDTTDALEIAEEESVSFPFIPIKPGVPLMTSGVVKKIVPVPISEADLDSPFIEDEPEDTLERLKESFNEKILVENVPEQDPAPVLKKAIEPQNELVTTIQSTNLTLVTPEAPIASTPPEEIIEPRPLLPPAEQKQETAGQQINNLFNSSMENLNQNNLEKFASIQLVPDKTIRIILTGDLLFDIGSAELSNNAQNSLEKISSVIKNTPYMINIVGHTDNVPMTSDKFATNWELSVTRASTVARFLITRMGMNPNQFVVSGYSSYRPVKPNTNVKNRATNRRVEIIVSKRLPTPLPASKESSLN